MTHTSAALHLKFEIQENRTIMRVGKQEPPLRVIRAFPLASSMTAASPIEQSSNGHHADAHGGQSLPADLHHTAPHRTLPHHTLPHHAAPHHSDLSHASEHENNGNAQSGEECIQSALVHLHNVSGGLLGGDQLHLDVTIGPQARAQLTSTGSTRVYRRRVGYLPTAQTAHLRVEAGGLLEYLPDSLIPYAHSQYHQSMRIELAEDAGLFYWEIITPGREAKGECFEYDHLQIELDIVADGCPIAIERSRLEPARYTLTNPDATITDFDSLARLGPYRYFATFYICRVGVEKSRWLELEKRLDEEARVISEQGAILWGVSTLPAHGLCVRAVGNSSHLIQQTLPRFWQLAKEKLYQQNAVMPRKMY